MKVRADPNLFWYLKEGVQFNLEDPSSLDMYVQQILTRGRTKDVTKLLMQTSPNQFKASFKRIKSFIPAEVRLFWEDFIGNY